MGGLVPFGAERQADAHELVATPLAEVVAEQRIVRRPASR